ncbi:MAG: response regulator [Isosphaeraceae bacterium]
MRTAPLCISTTTTLPAARPFILLVDDHEPSLRGLSEVMERAGLRCVAAGSPADALVYCNTRRPRVVVTDLAMPEIDGGTLGRLLQARYPGIPLVLITGHDLDDPAVVPLRSIFRAILTKPLEPDEILCLVHGLMASPESSPSDETSDGTKAIAKGQGGDGGSTSKGIRTSESSHPLTLTE